MSVDCLDLFTLNQFTHIAGVDEVGRGCLAGPVVAAAVILNPDEPIEGLRDSKKLSAHRRDELADESKRKALAWAVVKGDDSVAEISAASIIAKTTRDAFMVKMAQRYPQYGFEHNVGYGTAVHLQALKDFGPTPIHRMTFAPVKDFVHGLSTHSK